jgi:hypothetical protein
MANIDWRGGFGGADRRSADGNAERPQSHHHDGAGHHAPAARDGKAHREREDMLNLFCCHDAPRITPIDPSHGVMPRATTSLIKG